MAELEKIIDYMHAPGQHDDLTQAQRLFHGRGHAYPGLHHVTVDWLPPVILITLFSPEEPAHIEALSANLLSHFPQCQSVQLQHRYVLNGPIDLLWGEPIHELVVEENGLKFHIHLGKARNTGLFLDMRNGRDWVRWHSRHKKVLNLFSYTCGFSVAAIAGQADFVMNVDMSRAALSLGRQNHRLNQQDLSRVRFDKVDIFKSFGRFKKSGPFDLLVCDPPTFQKGSVDIRRDYPKIMRRLDQFMAPDATLILCLNAPALGEDFLMDNMAQCAPEYKVVKQITAPSVFKDTQGRGLTILCFKREEYKQSG